MSRTLANFANFAEGPLSKLPTKPHNLFCIAALNFSVATSNNAGGRHTTHIPPHYTYTATLHTYRYAERRPHLGPHQHDAQLALWATEQRQAAILAHLRRQATEETLEEGARKTACKQVRACAKHTYTTVLGL